MLKKMRRRVILAAMLAFLAVILLIAGLVNVVNYYVVTNQADQTLSYILRYEQGTPAPPAQAAPAPEAPAQGAPAPDGPGPEGAGPGDMPPGAFLALPDLEANYSTRFFVVRCDGEQNMSAASMDYIASVDEEEALRYAEQALARGSRRGYLGEYRYAVTDTADGQALIFLNVSQDLEYMRSLGILTAAVSGGSLLLVFLLVVLFSGHAIRPIARNIELQKQFITDASHELKTPLTSISTSMDVIAMEHGEDEWTENVRAQTGRMTKLVSELVTLSRLDEELPLPNKEPFSLSSAAWEIAEVYQPQAKARGKKLTVEIEEDLTLLGEKAAIQQMLSVLLDNALRYSDEGGEIRFRVFRRRNRSQIEVFNTCDYPEPPDVKRLFDRFYRPDSSRSSSTGGTGVGLAIAKAVAETHGGSIRAICPSGKTMTIRVSL